MTTAKEIRDMPNEELLEYVRVIRRELFGLRFAHATGELENTAGVGVARRNLARALTVARERGLQAQAAEITAGVEG
jgi:large subunit ribosomal protein L29